MYKKILFISMGVVLFFTGCAPKRLLYSWSNYDSTSYTYLKKGDEASRANLIKSYRQMIERKAGTRRTVPPGIYADYGFLLLQNGNTEEGKAMLSKEISLYPESKVFIESILKMLEQ